MFSPIFATISNNSVNLTNKFIKRKSIHLDNDFKQVNQVKYSQLFKSKSVCSVKSSKNSQKHHSVNSLNRLSWLDRRSWSFKRGLIELKFEFYLLFILKIIETFIINLRI